MKKNILFSKLILILFCIGMVLPMFSSCSKDNNTSVKIPLETVPTCFDPQISSGAEEEGILNNCLEGLVRIDSDGGVSNGVADSWSVSSDGLTYSFSLRSDAKWHLPSDLEDILGEDYKKIFDTRVTAHDFVFGISRAMDPETGSPMADSLSCIKSISAESDTKLKIVLKQPNINFLTLLASPAAMPCNETFFEATAGRYGLAANLLLCNGPYYLGSIDEESGVVIYKNSDYNGNYKALFSTGKFLITKSFLSSDSSDQTDEETTLPSVYSLLASEDGGYDIATVTKSESESLKEEDYTIEHYKNTVKAFCFNQNNNSLSNSNIRMALAYATNPDIFCKEYTYAEGIIPSCCGKLVESDEKSGGIVRVPYRSESDVVRPLEYNDETATSYYKEAVNNNYDADGELQELSLEFSLVCLKEDETNVKRVLQDWQKVFGVSLSVTITAYDTQSEIDTVVNSGNYDIAYTSLTASECLATDFLSRFTSNSGMNIVGFKSTEYDSIMSQAMNASSSDELISLTKSAETLLLKSGCIVPTCAVDGYLAKDSAAEKITVRPSGSIYALYTLK